MLNPLWTVKYNINLGKICIRKRIHKLLLPSNQLYVKANHLPYIHNSLCQLYYSIEPISQHNY